MESPFLLICKLRSCRHGKHKAKYLKGPAFKKQKTGYAQLEVQFLHCCMLCATGKNGQLPSPMTFDKNQRSRLILLDKLLNQTERAYNKAATIRAMYNAFDCLYFADDWTSIADSIFNSPVAVFLALKCLHPDSGYITIWDFPTMMTKAQFSIRVRACRKLRDSLTTCLSNGSHKKKPWFE
jgi:hypothetical protein